MISSLLSPESISLRHFLPPMSHGFSSSSDHHHHHLLMDKENLFSSPHEDYATGLTRRFSRSVSLQQPLFNFKENPVFSGSPESNEDAWNLIYTAAGQVSRTNMKTSISNSHGGLTGGFPWRRRYDGEELFRQQHFSRSRCVAAWPPPRQQQNHGGGTAAKRGTGVFLPRRYCTSSNPPESRKRQGCTPANMPARVIQYTSIAPPQIQSQINTSFVSHYEMLMSRRKAMISGFQRRQSDINGGFMEAPNNPEMLLPQEWTY